MHSALMQEMHQRLAAARAKAGYSGPTEAAHALGEKPPTYLGHENGSRGFGRTKADKYARKFNVSLEWLITGRGPRERRSGPGSERKMVDLVGYVGAGATAYFTAAGELGEVEAPAGATDDTVAVEIRGDSLGALFDRWLCFYDRVERPVQSDLIGKLCVVGLEDGRILVKKIQRSRTKGLYHLLSNTEEPIMDVAIEWAARVKIMVPR